MLVARDAAPESFPNGAVTLPLLPLAASLSFLTTSLFFWRSTRRPLCPFLHLLPEIVRRPLVETKLRRGGVHFVRSRTLPDHLLRVLLQDGREIQGHIDLLRTEDPLARHVHADDLGRDMLWVSL